MVLESLKELHITEEFWTMGYILLSDHFGGAKGCRSGRKTVRLNFTLSLEVAKKLTYCPFSNAIDSEIFKARNDFCIY